MLGKPRIGGLVLLAATVAVVGLLVVRDDDDPVNRGAVAAVDRTQVTTVDAAPVPNGRRNGRIIHARPVFLTREKPPRLKGSMYPVWNAFDQDTGSFLYVSDPEDRPRRVFVIGDDGPISRFECDPSVMCGRVDTFGPGTAEITMPAFAPDRQGRHSLKVMTFDGTVRDTLDISAVFTGDGRDQVLADLAWSPDGTRLAVGTHPGPEPGCDPESGQNCEGKVWILDRNGGEPQLVYTEQTSDDLDEGEFPDQRVLWNLAWSPDGRRLALVANKHSLTAGREHDPSKAGVHEFPRLVALQLAPGRPVRADTLHVYYDDFHGGSPLLAKDHHTHFAFAWSPDGTRIAVTSEGGIAEISASDGDVLSRHRGKELHGPLAWLRERQGSS